MGQFKNHLGPILDHLEPFEIIWDHFEPFCTFCDHFPQFEESGKRHVRGGRDLRESVDRVERERRESVKKGERVGRK